MIKFNKVTLKNFKSFGNTPTSFKLDSTGSTLILGDNQDIGERGNSKNGVGKCLGKDTPVMMYDGSIKLIQDIHVGELVMGDDGTPRKVLSTSSGTDELFLVKQNIGMNYVVNSSHVLSLKVGTDRPKHNLVKGTIVNISIGDYLSYPLAVKKSLCGYIGDLTDLDNGVDVFEPWLIGLWLADGTSAKPEITFNRDDVELIDEARRIANQYEWKTNISPSANRLNCFQEYFSGGLVHKLQSIGIFNNKHIPREYLQASYENRLELLAGFLDGDGHKVANRHAYDMTLKDNQLALDLEFLARSLGLRVSVVDKFCSCDGFSGEIYKRLTITGDVEKIPNKLTRKKTPPKAATTKPRHFGVTGISVESIGEGEYYGFEVDGNHLFCLGDMTVTHNSTFMAAVVFALYGKDIEKMKPDEMVNFKNKKNMTVELEFECKGVVYRIVRGRKPSVLELYADGQSMTRDSMKNTDETILDVIGIDYDIFLSIFFLNTFRPTFMSLGSAGQRDFIEKVLGLDTLASRAEALKLMKKEFNVDLKLANKDLEAAISFDKQQQEQLDWLSSEVESFDKKKAQDISSLETQLDELSGIDFDAVIARSLTIEQSPYTSEISEVNSEKTLLNEKLRSANEKLRSFIKANESFKEWEESYAKSIAELTEKLDLYPSIDDIENRDNTLKKIEGLDSKIVGFQDQQRKISEIDIPAITSEQEKLEVEFVSLDAGECPYCKQSHSDVDRMGEIESEFVNLEERIDKLNEMRKDIDASLNDALDKHNELKESLPDIPRSASVEGFNRLRERLSDMEGQNNPYEEHDLSEINEVIASIKSDIDTVDERLSSLKEQDKEHNESQDIVRQELTDSVGSYKTVDIERKKTEVDNIHRKIDDLLDQPNPFVVKLKQMEESIEESKVDAAEAEVDLIEKYIKHSDYMIKLLTDPKSFIRRNILDQYLPFLNKRIYEYCTLLDGAHIAEINSDMTVSIEYIGEVSYFSMSRGERFRLDIATTMAFRDLMKMMGKATNVLFVDEVLDNALDPHGTLKVFNLITSASDNTLLISHRTEFETLVDDVMVITKRNGFTVVDDDS